MKQISVTMRDTAIGPNSPIAVQTMCNTNTNDIESSVAQCEEMADAGADIIRLTTQGEREVASLAIIKQRLIDENINIPLVADIHFSAKAAFAAAKVADKVRINPGNFAKTQEQAQKDFRTFLKICKENHTVIRIGINHGSLGKRITELYGNTPKGMKEAMVEWVNMCIEEEFYDVVLSLKASNTVVMVEAYRLVYQWMKEKGIMFPLHVGVTEAGNGDMGRIKSAVGTATLLKEGIGDTIRVSLTEDPVNEIPVGKMITSYFEKDHILPKDNNFVFKAATHEEFIVKAACEIGPLLMNNEIEDFTIKGNINNKPAAPEKLSTLKDNILQAARKKFTTCEYVACPGCGRTLYDLQAAFNEVKSKTSHLRGLSIAVMGCIVNGPGEMADADYGYVGEGGGKVSIYRKQEPVFRGVPQEEAVEKLLKLIDDDKKL